MPLRAVVRVLGRIAAMVAIVAGALSAMPPPAQAAVAGLSVNVGYADNVRPSPQNWPTPWEGSPNVVYEGCTPTTGCEMDSGAIELVNTSGAGMTIDSVTVAYDTCVFDIWPHSVVLPKNSEMVLTQTLSGAGNGCTPGTTTGTQTMDSSDFGPNGAGWSGNCNDSGVVPVVTVTVGGVASNYNDTGKVLNTGGVDLASCSTTSPPRQMGNESTQWTPIGHVACPKANLTLTPASQALAPSGTASLTATLKDTCNTPLQGASVDFNVTQGPNTGLTFTKTTNSSGTAVFTYPDTISTPRQGVDRDVATVSNPAGIIASATSYVLWQTATLTLNPPSGLPGASISFTGTGYQAGETVKLHPNNPAALTLATVTADPSGNITGSFIVPAPGPSGTFLAGGMNQAVAAGSTSLKQGWAVFNSFCTNDWAKAADGDYNTAANWTAAVVPGASDVACIILPGTYDVAMNTTNPVGGFFLGNPTSGAQSLTIPGHSSFLNLSGAGTIRAGGVFNLGSVDGNYSGVGGGTITNNGTFNALLDNGGPRYLRSQFVNQGTVVAQSFNFRLDGPTVFTNKATVNVPSGGAISVLSGSQFMQQAGTVTTALGGLVVDQSTYTQTGGGVSGTVLISNGTFNDSAGSGSFVLQCTDTLNGPVPAGQTILVQGNPRCGTAVANFAPGGVTNNGTILLDSTDGNAAVAQGGTLTNNGTFGSLQDNGGQRWFRTSIINHVAGTLSFADFDNRMDSGSTTITNNGAFTIPAGGAFSIFGSGDVFNQQGGTLSAPPNQLYLQSGTWNQSGGTLTGTFVLNGDTFNTSGGSGGTFLFECSNNASGVVPSGETLLVQANGCGEAHVNLGGNTLVNNGTITMDSTTGGSSFFDNGTLDNEHALTLLQHNGGGRYLRVAVTNGSGATLTDNSFLGVMDGGSGNPLTNNGTITVGAKKLFFVNGPVTQANGTIANNGTVEAQNTTFTFAGGTTTGNEVIVDGTSTFNDNTLHAGLFAFRNNTAFTAATLDGAGNIPVPAGQVLDLRDDCTGAFNFTASNPIFLTGQLMFSGRPGCSGFNGTLTVPGTGLNVPSGGVFTANLAPAGSSGTRTLSTAVNLASGGTAAFNSPTQVNQAVVNNGTLNVSRGGMLSLVNGAGFSQTAGAALGVTVDVPNNTGWGLSGGGQTVAGTLNVTTVGTPASGASFTVLSSSALSGTFSTVNSAVPYTTAYANNVVTLTK